MGLQNNNSEFKLIKSEVLMLFNKLKLVKNF